MEKKELEVLLLCQLILKMNQLESKTISGKIPRNGHFTEIFGSSKNPIRRKIRFVEKYDSSKNMIRRKIRFVGKYDS